VGRYVVPCPECAVEADHRARDSESAAAQSAGPAPRIRLAPDASVVLNREAGVIRRDPACTPWIATLSLKRICDSVACQAGTILIVAVTIDPAGNVVVSPLLLYT
jgi:hypothetical protein